MKRITAVQIRIVMILLTATLFALNIAVASAQDVTRDKDGNYTAAAKVTAAHDSTTTFTYTDKSGKVEPVYKGTRGGKYLARTSKPSSRNNYTPRYYRKYLKD